MQIDTDLHIEATSKWPYQNNKITDINSTTLQTIWNIVNSPDLADALNHKDIFHLQEVFNHLEDWEFTKEDKEKLNNVFDSCQKYPDITEQVIKRIKDIYRNNRQENVDIDTIISKEQSRKNLVAIFDEYHTRYAHKYENWLPTLEEAQKIAEQNDNFSISINTSSKYIADILKNGYQNWFLLDHNEGFLHDWSMANRLFIEKEYNILFKNPVYWALAYWEWEKALGGSGQWWIDGKEMGIGTSSYWRVSMILKSSLNERVTSTFWDSFWEGKMLRMEESKIAKILATSLWDMKVNYMEMQIYWGITSEDIESIRYPWITTDDFGNMYGAIKKQKEEIWNLCSEVWKYEIHVIMSVPKLLLPSLEGFWYKKHLQEMQEAYPNLEIQYV